MHCGSDLTLPSMAPSTKQGADFGTMFNAAFATWKENLNDLFILTLVSLLICWIPIANIGFNAGYTRSLLKVARGEGKAQLGDLFKAWDCFAGLFVFGLINLIIVIGLHYIPVLGTVASLSLGFVMVPGVLLIIDKGLGVSDAFSWCFSTFKEDFVNWFLACLVGIVIIGVGTVLFFFGISLIGVGAVLFFFGIILTAPLGQLVIIAQYERVKPAEGEFRGSVLNDR